MVSMRREAGLRSPSTGNRTSHCHEFFARSQCLSCVGKYHLSGWRHSDSMAVSIKDWEFDLFFEISNLFTQRWLGEEEALSGACEVRCFCNGDDVFEESKLQRI